MTFIAQQALEDARYVRDRLSNHPVGPEWRVLWTAGVSLLRTVGYALQKRDVPEERPREREAYVESWQRWKKTSEENDIWHHFINHERHRLQKEYRSAVVESQATYVAPGLNIVLSNDPRVMPFSVDEGEPIEGIQVRHTIAFGHYEGREALDVYDQALDWLACEIAKIENRIQEIQKS